MINLVADVAIEILHDVYTPLGVVSALNNPRREWNGLNANEMIDTGHAAEVYEWAQRLAGGPLRGSSEASHGQHGRALEFAAMRDILNRQTRNPEEG